jgi:recombination protein RecT
MTQEMTTTRDFIGQFESPKSQQALKQYFEKDDSQKLFTQVVVRAVQEQPDLLLADRTSLFLACQTAAQDGLLPDRKDGALVVYNTKKGDRWVKQVQWQPMIGGLRKKLANHGFSLRAEIVYENDEFSYEMGDEPKIIHRPVVFGDRGEIVGAYAIATDQDGNKFRETMTAAELEKVRASSKNPNGGAWATWTTEMYRKTVAKRLFKTLPLISTELSELIDRDNQQYVDMGKPAGVSSVAKAVQATVREDAKEPLEGEVVSAPKKKKGVRKKAAAKKPATPEPDQEGGERVGDDWLKEYNDYVPDDVVEPDDDDPLA